MIRTAPASLLFALVLASVLLSPAEAQVEPSESAGDESATEHPLTPVLKLAQEGYDRIGAEVRDYTCRIIRRERLAGKLKPYEFMSVKVRHQQPAATDEAEATPFSVYLRFDKPTALAGREVLFLEGRPTGTRSGHP